MRNKEKMSSFQTLKTFVSSLLVLCLSHLYCCVVTTLLQIRAHAPLVISDAALELILESAVQALDLVLDVALVEEVPLGVGALAPRLLLVQAAQVDRQRPELLLAEVSLAEVVNIGAAFRVLAATRCDSIKQFWGKHQIKMIEM